MRKIVRLTETDLKNIVKRVLSESDGENQGSKKEKKPRCIPENIIALDEIVGNADEYSPYSNSVLRRGNGVNSMVDTLAILNNIRLLKDVKDGGTHLAYEMMNNVNKYRNKNYYDETSGGCNSAMDKIIELYKENEHGTELVKDIEKVLNLQVREDDTTPSSRAKEYLKQTLNIIKGV